MQETPMSYLYNTSCLLRTIRDGEENTPTASFTDEAGRELLFEGSLIRLDNFTLMINGLREEYQQIVKAELFFGEPIPAQLQLDFNIRDLAENPRNFSPGFCFLDDPRNPFNNLRTTYGEWLLADATRASRFTYQHNGKLIWKPKPCLDLLGSFQRARNIMLVLVIVACGPSTRATEVATEPLRNISGVELRSLLILYHTLCLVGIQDKTSHKFLRNSFTPHCPTIAVSTDLIYNLAVFRPFEESLVNILLGSGHAKRFHLYLWPDLLKNTTSDQLSNLLGAATLKYVKFPLKIRKYRHIQSVFGRRHGDPRLYEISKEFYFDMLQNHGTGLSYRTYAVEVDAIANADPRHIVGCIKTCAAWHITANVGQENPISVSIDGNESGPFLPELANAELWNKAERQSTSFTGLPTGLELTRFANAISDANRINTERIMRQSLTEIMSELVPRYFGPPPPLQPPEALRQISTIMVHPSRRRALRTFLGDETATLPPEQGELLEKMLARQNHILAILPAGAGKTLMVFLQCKMYNADLTAVMVLPLSGLHADLEYRAKKHGVSISRWLPGGKFNPNVMLVYVSIEHASFGEFLTQVSSLIDILSLTLVEQVLP
jgi:hypothetical protein